MLPVFVAQGVMAGVVSLPLGCVLVPVSPAEFQPAGDGFDSTAQLDPWAGAGLCWRPAPRCRGGVTTAVPSRCPQPGPSAGLVAVSKVGWSWPSGPSAGVPGGGFSW